MEVLINNGTFFNILNRSVANEYLARNTRLPSLANTYQNEPQFQQVQNLARNYMRIGNQKFADPFAFHQRPNDFYYNGRRTAILDTLILNATRDKPDVITLNPLRVTGYY